MPTPFITFSLHSIHARRIDEYHWWPGNTDIELYQTWTLTEPAVLDAEGDPVRPSWARMGFSTIGGPRGYVRFKIGEQIDVIDPKFELALDLPESGQRRLELTMHFWEQNSGKNTERVKLLSSNESLKHLVAMYRAANQDKQRAIDHFRRWYDDNFDNLVLAGLASVSAAAAGIAKQLDLVDLVQSLVALAAERGDTYLGNHQLLLEVRRGTGAEQGRYAFRTHLIGSAESAVWIDAGLQKRTAQLRDGPGGNILEVEYRTLLIGAG